MALPVTENFPELVSRVGAAQQGPVDVVPSLPAGSNVLFNKIKEGRKESGRGNKHLICQLRGGGRRVAIILWVIW